MRNRDQTFLDPLQSANRIGHWLSLLILLSSLSSISSFSNGGVSTKIPFQFVGDSSGIEFEHRNGMQSELWLLEVIGSGAALLDYDDDGRLDIWLVQSDGVDHVYRNVTSKGRLSFERVDEILLSSPADGYGIGIAVGDISNDGDLDVFLANYGQNQLYLNDGGQFRRVDSGLELHEDWSVAGSFADYDGDGLLDLYVVNYVQWQKETHKVCHDMAGRPDYCAPDVFPAAHDRVYRNLGTARFRDVSEQIGITKDASPGLGVIARDLNADGWVDFFVANDATDNQLWLNRQGRILVDDALLAGVAVNGDGEVEASMGVTAEDFDRDCHTDLFITHLAAETNTLYRGAGDGWFSDATNVHGLGLASTPFTGFGTRWLDFDNDGDLDLYTVNGAVSRLQDQALQGVAYPLRQRNQFWVNEEGRYSVVMSSDKAVGRGLAIGDIDNDGDIDMLITNSHGRPQLLRNTTDALGRDWIGIELNAPGALTLGSTVELGSQECVKAIVQTDGSYASASDHRVVFGISGNLLRTDVIVRWSDSSVEQFGRLKLNRYHSLRKGRGAPVPSDLELGAVHGVSQ